MPSNIIARRYAPPLASLRDDFRLRDDVILIRQHDRLGRQHIMGYEYCTMGKHARLYARAKYFRTKAIECRHS